MKVIAYKVLIKKFKKLKQSINRVMLYRIY
jgi:hypothetical protein